MTNSKSTNPKCHKLTFDISIKYTNGKAIEVIEIAKKLASTREMTPFSSPAPALCLPFHWRLRNCVQIEDKEIYK